ncbi:hypothetical protein [Vibrio sp. 10N.239.312.D08]|uniref:hypothetical protein n=1 Tax=Vibrio sp. 10N.239.312.D08 TaxID=3229978 RepID=UPI003552F11B
MAYYTNKEFAPYPMLNTNLFNLMYDAVSTVGSYDPEDVVPYFEEALTFEQSTVMWDLFAWLHTNRRNFGTNFVETFGEFYIQSSQEIKDMVDGKIKTDFDISKMTLTETPPPTALKINLVEAAPPTSKK